MQNGIQHTKCVQSACAVIGDAFDENDQLDNAPEYYFYPEYCLYDLPAWAEFLGVYAVAAVEEQEKKGEGHEDQLQDAYAHQPRLVGQGPVVG